MSLSSRLLVALLSIACHHQPPVAPAEPTPAGPADRPLLVWRVEKDGVEPSWLMGTCHLSLPLDYVLPAPYRGALGTARVVMTEISLENLDPMAILKQLKAESPLREQLGDDDFARFAGAFGATIPGPFLDRMPAWVAFSMTAVLVPTPGGPPVLPVIDQQVQAVATQNQLAQQPLETMDQQIALMQRHDAEFADAIRQMMLPPEPGALTGEEMAAACETTDPAVMLDIVTRMGTGEMSTELLADRNRVWMPTLEEELGRGSAFVAVGAGHLVGEQGVVALLRARGFTVTPMRAPAVDPAAAPRTPIVKPTWSEPPTPAARASWAKEFERIGVPAFCGGGAVDLAATLGLSAEACRSNIAAAADVCALQHASTLPATGGMGAVPAELQLRIAGCAGTDLVYQAMMAGTLPTPPK